MSEHTPGPWVFGRWNILDADRASQTRGEPYWTLEDGEDVLTQGPIGRKVKDREDIISPCGYECDGIVVSDENKALIEAAPALLEACKGLLELWKGDFLNQGGSPDMLDRLERISSVPELGNAVRAIEKAEGRTGRKQ